jgi:hypothetical protein
MISVGLQGEEGKMLEVNSMKYGTRNTEGVKEMAQLEYLRFYCLLTVARLIKEGRERWTGYV